jgi:hypothetical protein
MIKPEAKEIKKVLLEPEFITTLRSGGSVDVLTIPKNIMETFKYYHEIDLEGLRTWINRESISLHIPKFALDQTRLTEFAEAL